MTLRLLALTCLCSLSPGLALAGEPAVPAPAISTAAPGTSPWEIYATLPVWAAGLEGNIGVGGFQPLPVDVGFGQIFEHLDMTASMALEARYRRWGVLVDGLYLKVSASGEPPGRLLSSVDVQVEQVIAEVAVTYRLLEGKRGYLDVLAGARYMLVENELNFHLDAAGVREVSEELGNAAVDRAVRRIEDEVGRAAARARARLAALDLDERSDALRDELRQGAIERILEETTIREIIETIRRLTPAEREQIRQKVETSRQVHAANKALAEAVIQERVATAVSAARRKAQRAVARARKQLAAAIESAIRRAIPEQVIARESWVDPFVGLRGRYNFTDKVYLAARADVGGFGIASDLTWNACGAIGCRLSERWSTELGWRHLSVDYREGGFVFDAQMSGLYLGLTCRL